MLYSQAKVKVLAEMWRRSGRDMVVYTGAGGHPARPWQMGAKMMVMYYLKRSKKAIQKIAKRYKKTQAHSTNQTIEHRWQLGKQLWELTRPKEVVDVCSGYMDIWQSNIYIYVFIYLYTYMTEIVILDGDCHYCPLKLTDVLSSGLSTASGIGDYASKAGGSIAPHKQLGTSRCNGPSQGAAR